MSNLEKIKNLILSSNLTTEEQKEFLNLLSQIQEKDLEGILSLFEENKDWMKKFYNNYKFKKQAFENKDKNLWNKILDEEKEELEKIN
ncbi:MAG: hypothetical protein V1768_03860 [Patescibacteria group bacterium]|nr:hypothetical protein [Patescibacteria group bacterium]MBU1160420.1 hypothetical protein [Patescibacteria group bacterium]MBU1684123.1 hypothetical protein [Patescibacteria group bacterium]MBU1987612.1 hypothetical protein [Patescibacteria group bacterium]MBU2416102.1 hypothetical protein [Patescibacteria group bacterium]